jgi:hypothetical protein
MKVKETTVSQAVLTSRLFHSLFILHSLKRWDYDRDIKTETHPALVHKLIKIYIVKLLAEWNHATR